MKNITAGYSKTSIENNSFLRHTGFAQGVSIYKDKGVSMSCIV